MVRLLSFNIKELIEEIKKRNIHSYFNGYLYILIKWANNGELQYKHHAVISWRDENCAYWNGEVGR